MLKRVTCFRAATCIILLAAVLSFASASQITKQLAPGITLNQEINTDPALVINAVTVDTKCSGTSVKAAIGRDIVYIKDALQGRESISALTERRGALLGLNADFFPYTGDPLGLCIIDSELISEPTNNRAVVAIRKDGSAVFDNPTFDAKLTLSNNISRQIDGINRSRDTNQVVLYTSTFGNSTATKYAGVEAILTSDELPVCPSKNISFTVTQVRENATDTPIPKGGAVLSSGGPAAFFLKENLNVGDKLTVRFDIKSPNGVDYAQVDNCVSGGPWILKDGKQFIDLENEIMGPEFSSDRHPRTAVGITSAGKLILATVDGRQRFSRGINLPDLSDLMKRLGATSAINLDGGGSTTLSYRGIILNSPSGGEQRPVANALLVFAKSDSFEQLPNLAIECADEVAEDKGAQLLLTSNACPVTSDVLNRTVWGTSNGGGFVNQQGYFTPLGLKRTGIRAFYGSQLVSRDAKVIAGTAVKINIILNADKQNPLVAKLIIKVVDSVGGPCVGSPVLLVVTGGKADADSGVIGDKGEFVTTITWDDSTTGRSIKATSGDLTSTWTPAN